jgi:hypothetical protein
MHAPLQQLELIVLEQTTGAPDFKHTFVGLGVGLKVGGGGTVGDEVGRGDGGGVGTGGPQEAPFSEMRT